MLALCNVQSVTQKWEQCAQKAALVHSFSYGWAEGQGTLMMVSWQRKGGTVPAPGFYANRMSHAPAGRKAKTSAGAPGLYTFRNTEAGMPALVCRCHLRAAGGSLGALGGTGRQVGLRGTGGTIASPRCRPTRRV